MKIIAAACLLLCELAYAREQSPLAVVAQSAVMIVVDSRDGLHFGSGVVIRRSSTETLILTCAHVIGDATTAIISPDAPLPDVSASVVKIDRDADLALLSAADVGLPALRLARREPRIYDELYVSGMPDRVRDITFVTLLTHVPTPGTGQAHWRLSGGVFYPGLSGAPVASRSGLACLVLAVDYDETREVVIQGIGYCIPLPAIRSFLAEYRL